MAEREATVFIVDDDKAVRDSLSLLMESVHQRAQASASAQEFLEAWDGQPGDVLVLDIRLPGMSGLALQAKLRELSSVLPIIFITGYGDVPTAVQAMRDGAFDFVQKPFRSQDLLDAIQAALSAGASARKGYLERQRVLKRLARLTKRERGVLEMMVEGKSNKVMAIDLNLSQRTVEVHRANVMRKMEVDSLAALVRTFLVATSERSSTLRPRSGLRDAIRAATAGGYRAAEPGSIIEQIS